MLPFGSKLAVAGSLLANGDAAVVKNAPRSTVGCVELSSPANEYFYGVASTNTAAQTEMIRLAVDFQESGDLALVDQGYLKLTYDQDMPDGYTLAETQENDGMISSYEADGNELVLQIADSRSGQHGHMWFVFNHSSGATFNSIEYCVAPSPTANIPTFDEVSDVNMCEDVELNLEGNFNCRACSTVHANSAALAGSYDDGDYLEIEFSGFIKFRPNEGNSLDEKYNRVKEVRFVQGNVWQIFFSDWYDFNQGLDFKLELEFIGSQKVDVNWSRMCQAEALAGIDDSVFVSQVPDNCIALQGTVSDIYHYDRFNHVWSDFYDARESSVTLVMEPNDRDSDFFLKDYTYFEYVFYPPPEASGIVENPSPPSDAKSMTSARTNTYKTTSLEMDGNKITVDFDDSLSGSKIVIMNMEFLYENSPPAYRPIMRDVFMCTGTNPTAAVPSVEPLTNAEFCQDISDYVAVDGSVACRACMAIQGDSSAFNDLIEGSYIEMEFGGIVEFIGQSEQFSDIENVSGTNVWRFYYAESQTDISFTQQIKFTGSEAMAPRINWAQACNPPAGATSAPSTTISSGNDDTTEMAVTTSQPPETDAPLSRLSCHELDSWSYDVTKNEQDGHQAILTPHFTDGLAVQQFSYLQLTYDEGFTWVEVAGSSLPWQVLVQVSAGWPATNSFVTDNNSVIVELGAGAIEAGDFALDLSYGYAGNRRSIKTTSNPQSVSICHRTTESVEVGPLTDDSWCWINPEFDFQMHETCEQCATMRITNPKELPIDELHFIEFETDAFVEFTSVNWPIDRVEPIQNNVQRIHFVDEFTYDGPDVLSVGEVRLTDADEPAELLFMNVCPIEEMGNPNESTSTSTATTFPTTTDSDDSTGGPPTTEPPTTTPIVTGGHTHESTTPTTTTPATTTTPGECEDNFEWVGNDKVKLLEIGTFTVEARVTMTKMPESQPYTGFIIWPRKKCGVSFLEAMTNGTITYDVMDTTGGHNYESPQFTYFRDDKGKSSVTMQWGSPNPPKTGLDGYLGNNKKDQLVINFWGLASFDWSVDEKNLMECLTSGQVGNAEYDAANRTQCAGETKTLFV